jgi:ABC-type transport system involved in multi-copper enzyme maturation permease subunit
MTWLAWRQSRLQFLIAACALLLLTLAFALTEPGLHHLSAEYGARPAAFLAQVQTGGYPVLYFVGGAVMYLTPLVIGAFWGAPLIARELEAGTHRLTWNQSVTRTRWLLVKIAIGGGAAMLFAGIAGLLLSWWAGPGRSTGPAGSLSVPASCPGSIRSSSAPAASSPSARPRSPS